MNDTLTFAQPEWLYLIPALIPLAILRYRSQRFRERAVDALVASRLRPHLIIGQRAGSHWGRFSLQLLALALLLVALARPQFGFVEEKLFSKGRNVLIAIDTSRSMLANDVQPSRLARAKLLTSQDLVASLPSDRIGLIAFAGSSFLQAPLTVDHEAVVEAITQLDTSIIPRGGTNLGKAIALARKTFEEAGSENNALILFSDGEDLEEGSPAKKSTPGADEVSMTLIAVGIGTATGSIIPDPDAQDPGRFIQDHEGNIVRSRLDAPALKKHATAWGGLYLNLNSTRSVQGVVSSAISKLQATHEENKTARKPIDRYRWPLAAGILALLCSLVPISVKLPNPFHTVRPRRSESTDTTTTATTSTTVAAIALLAMLTPATGLAGTAQEAYRDYEKESYEEALAKYQMQLRDAHSLDNRSELHYGAGSAAYKLGDFQQAIKSYGNALLSDRRDMQEKSHYSLGNALYREGELRLENPEEANPEEALTQWHNSVDHYEAALALNQENENARFNLDLVKKRIEELEKQQQQQQQQDQQDKSDEQEQQENQDQQNQGDQEGDQDQQQQNQGDQESDQQQNNQGDQDQQDQNEGDQQDQDQQNPSEPMEEGETPEGQLQADEDQPEQRPGQPREEPDPETGFTKSQARQILRSLADEDLDVRPLVPPSRGDTYKNW